MKKRYTDCDIWEDDFFQRLSPTYKLLWFYICNKCDHAGIWKPSTVNFTATTKLRVRLDRFLAAVNRGKERVVVLDNGRWYLANFCQFQYTAADRVTKSGMNVKNSVHLSALRILNKNGIAFEFLLPEKGRKKNVCRVSTEVLQSVCLKDKDKVQYKRKNVLNIETVRTAIHTICPGCKVKVRREHFDGHKLNCPNQEYWRRQTVSEQELPDRKSG